MGKRPKMSLTCNKKIQFCSKLVKRERWVMAIERLKSAEKISKQTQSPSKLLKNAQNCSKMLKIAQNSLKVYKIALFYYCFHLPGSKHPNLKIAQNFSKMLKIVQKVVFLKTYSIYSISAFGCRM